MYIIEPDMNDSAPSNPTQLIMFDRASAAGGPGGEK